MNEDSMRITDLENLVAELETRIAKLEAAQQGVEPKAKKRRDKKDYFNPRDVAILGGDPSL